MARTTHDGGSSAMPSADDVACAVVAACRHTGEDPIECVASDKRKVRARFLAVLVLAESFTLNTKALAHMVGFRRMDNSPLSPSRWPNHVDPGSLRAVREEYGRLRVKCGAAVVREARPVVREVPAPAVPAPEAASAAGGQEPKLAPRRKPGPRPGVPTTLWGGAAQPTEKRLLREMIAAAFANTPGAVKA